MLPLEYTQSLSEHLFFFLISIIFKVIDLLQYCFCFMFWYFCPWGMWDLNSLTRDRTHTPCTGRWSLNSGPPGKSLLEHPYGITPETSNSPRAPSHQQPSQDVCISLCVSFLTGVLKMPEAGSGSFSSLPLEGPAQMLNMLLPCPNPSLTAPPPHYRLNLNSCSRLPGAGTCVSFYLISGHSFTP